MLLPHTSICYCFYYKCYWLLLFIILPMYYNNKLCLCVMLYSSRIRTLPCNHWTYLRITPSRLRAFLRYIQRCHCTNVVLAQYYTTDYANWFVCYCNDRHERCNFYVYVLCVFISVNKCHSCYRFSVFISFCCCAVNYYSLSLKLIYIVCSVCWWVIYISRNCDWNTYSCRLRCTSAACLYFYSCYCNYFCYFVNANNYFCCYCSDYDVIKIVLSCCWCYVSILQMSLCFCCYTYYFA